MVQCAFAFSLFSPCLLLIMSCLFSVFVYYLPYSDYTEKCSRWFHHQRVFNHSSNEVKAENLNAIRNWSESILPYSFDKMQCTPSSPLFLGHGNPGLLLKNLDSVSSARREWKMSLLCFRDFWFISLNFLPQPTLESANAMKKRSLYVFEPTQISNVALNLCN